MRKATAIACVAASSLIGVPASDAATLEEALRTCAELLQDGERLACFDTLAAGLGSDAEPKTEQPDSGTVGDLAPADDTAFGWPRDPQPDPAPAIVRSRHVGEFAGWSGTTVFRLENGQVWRQAQRGRVHWVAASPMITITETSLGTYWLSVEGINARVRVRRSE